MVAPTSIARARRSWVLGVLCFLLVDTSITMVAVFVGLAAIGAGMGATTTPATSMLVSAVPPEKAGVGSAMNDVTREAGAAFGVVVLLTVVALVLAKPPRDRAVEESS